MYTYIAYLHLDADLLLTYHMKLVWNVHPGSNSAAAKTLHDLAWNAWRHHIIIITVRRNTDTSEENRTGITIV